MTEIKSTGRDVGFLVWFALLVCIGTLSHAGANEREQTEMSQGRDGVASRYAGDQGIGNDPSVVFFEDFDLPSVREVADRWEAVENQQILSISSDVPPHVADQRSLLMTHVGGRSNGAHLYRRLTPGYEKLHVRFYVKFDEDCAPIHHFFHVGGYNPATAWPQGGAGERPRGDERFTTGIEPFGGDWRWDFYSYWMQMRGSPPRGQTWGNSFNHSPKLAVARGRWTCLELMMQLNDPGDSDGELALWIDGRLVSHLGQGFPHGKWVYDKFITGAGGDGVRWSDDKGGPEYFEVPAGGRPFEGFRWRSDQRLKLNFLWVLLYVTKAPSGHESHVWFDNIVVAHDYIGPLEPASP